MNPNQLSENVSTPYYWSDVCVVKLTFRAEGDPLIIEKWGPAEVGVGSASLLVQ